MLLLLLLRLLLATTITTASSSSNSQLFFFISNYLKPRPQGAKLAPSISHFYVHKMLKYGFLLFFGSSGCGSKLSFSLFQQTFDP